MQSVEFDKTRDGTHTFRFPNGSVLQVSVLNEQIIPRGLKRSSDYTETKDEEMNKVCVQSPDECKLVLYLNGSRGVNKTPFGLFAADVEHSVKWIEYEKDD